jgi:hypothetical protein
MAIDTLLCGNRPLAAVEALADFRAAGPASDAFPAADSCPASGRGKIAPENAVGRRRLTG